MGTCRTSREQFFVRFRRLHAVAGEPKLTAVAGGTAEQRVSDWMHTHVPRDFDQLRPVLTALIDRAQRRGPEPEPGLFLLAQWRRWWKDARSSRGASTKAGARVTDRSDAGTEGHTARSLADWDCFHLGVHRAISVQQPGEPDPLPPHPTYLPRDHDRRLDELLEDSPRSVMIVLVGGSSTGKTRAAYEALRRARPNWPLRRPVTASELTNVTAAGAEAGPTVLWLDETQRFLLGPDGPDAAAGLRRMLASRAGPIIVIGTMWPRYWTALTARPREEQPADHANAVEQDPHWQARELLLHLAQKIVVPETFVVPAHPPAPLDPRLVTAIAAAGRSGKVVQVLAGGITLVERYAQPASPIERQSQALLTAAMDARRLGHERPLRTAFLADATPGYLDPESRVQLSPDWFDRTLTEATAEHQGVCALAARRDGPGVGEPDGYVLADYLDQYGRSVRSGCAVPASTWESLIRHTADPDDRVRLALSARDRMLFRCAADLLGPAVEAGNPHATHMLADLALRTRKEEQIEPLLRRAVRAGDVDAAKSLARWLIRAGRDRDAELVLRDAAAAGDSEAIAGLAKRFADTGRHVEAQELLARLRRRAERGDPTGLLWWCAWLQWTKSTDLQDWLVEAIDAGVRRVLPGFRDMGPNWDDPRLERALQSLVEDGDSLAVRMLADRFRDTGRAAQVDPMLWRAAMAGSHAAVEMLHASLDDVQIHRLAVAGNAEAMVLNARRLAAAGNDRDADQWLRRGIQAGVIVGFSCWPSKREMDLCQPGRGGWMKRTFHSSRHTHHVDVICEGADGWRTAQQWFRDMAESGSRYSMQQIEVGAVRSDRDVDDPELFLRQLIEIDSGGHHDFELGLLLQDTGREHEAERLGRFGIEPGGATADEW